MLNVADAMKTCKNMKKMIKAQVLETLEWKFKRRKDTMNFYTGSLKLELHPVCQGNLSLTLHYFKSFTKYPPVHFQNMQKHHKRLLNHTRITQTQQEPSRRPGKPPGTHTKLEKDQTLVVAHPWLPQTIFSKLQTKPKAPRIDPRSIFNSCNTYDHEAVGFHKFPDQNRALKWSTDLSFENHNFYSQIVTKFSRLISLDISEISRLKTKSTN